jgi:hypothetical protein
VTAPGAVIEFADEFQAALPGVLFQQVVEGFANGRFLARAAITNDFFNLGVILLDELDGHERFFSTYGLSKKDTP